MKQHFRDFLVESLRAAGYTVLMAENGMEALKAAELHQGRISLLVTDMIMPRMSGPDLAKCIRRMYPEIQVLYMSGHNDDKLRAVSTNCELPLMQKPFHVKDLLQRVHESLIRARKIASGPQVQELPG